MVGINGSARRDGNTALLIGAVFRQLEAAGIETEMVQLAGRRIEGDTGCFACTGKGVCVCGRDFFNECFGKMVAADGMVLGSPVYLADVSSVMKALLERAGVVVASNPGLLRHKPGVG